jgi:hypothetical protein
MTVQIAQNLGLSRLPAELGPEASAREIRNAFGARWQLAADREVGRRVWWTLVGFRRLS